MAHEFTFRITTTRFDEDYSPSDNSRITTNFANLARGEQRQQNLRRALAMIDGRCNDLADWDNPGGDRYAVELDIVSVALRFAAAAEEQPFPLLEVLDVTVVDRWTGGRRRGIVGNNFSSYVRDFDFSVRLPAATADAGAFTVPDDFGALQRPDRIGLELGDFADRGLRHRKQLIADAGQHRGGDGERQWQLDRETGALACVGFELDRAAQLLQRFPHHVHAEAPAADAI